MKRTSSRNFKNTTRLELNNLLVRSTTGAQDAIYWTF
jgi:hypothetical protein